MQVNHIEIDNTLLENAVKISGVGNKKELIEKALLFFTQQAIDKSKTVSEKTQADLLMAFSGKVKFDRDGLAYQNAIRDNFAETNISP